MKSWGNAWFQHQLNPETGRHTLRLKKAAPGSEMVHGFASYEPVWGLGRRFYAVYGHQGRFIFQAGSRSWDLTDGSIEVGFKAFSRGAASKVSIKHNGSVIHHASLVHPFRALAAVVDPTFDGIDAEGAHFFLFLSNHMAEASWRRHVLSFSAAAA